LKRWKETAQIFGRVHRLPAAGRRAALATVVRVAGSAYRRPGAKLLIEQDGETMGSVSGGCLEADVREVGLQVLREGAPRLRHYDTGADDRVIWGLGLGCAGAVDVFVQDGTEEAALRVAEKVSELVEGDKPFAVATVVGGAGPVGRTLVVGAEGLLAGSTGDRALDGEIAREASRRIAGRESRLHDLGSAEVFTEVLMPPPRLILFGANDDAIPICAYASDIGFRVTVVDHRPALLPAERFPGAAARLALRPEEDTGALPLGPRTYAVVKTHSFAQDREWVRKLLDGGVAYIGLLGPRARTQEILRQIGAEAGDRVFGPVGLDLGAEGSEQVALSIVAELLAAHSSREPAHLREKEAAIHAT
jgi:xanthine/CO dehydrogenase XdhC/CoxF family maturation factor